MKLFFLIIFMLFSSVESKNYYVKLENNSNYIKYVLIKYENKKGETVTKEVRLKKNQHYDFFAYNPIFYLYSVSFNRRGKIRAGVHGKDGVGFIRKILKGKTAYYQKIDCEMQLRGVFKTVHLGI